MPLLLRRKLLAPALGIILLFSSVSMASESSLTFVALVQSNPGSLHSEFHSVEMYTIDSSHSLDSIWSTEISEISAVRIFPEVSSLLIEQYVGEGSRFRMISLSDLNQVALFDPAHDEIVISAHQYATGVQFGQLGFQMTSRDERDVRTSFYISPGLLTPNNPPEGEQSHGELRLAGYRPNSAKDDGVHFESVLSPRLWPRDSVPGIFIQAFPVPESVMVFKDSRFWIMFAHESSFLALRSVPDRKHEESEILIYTRQDRVWHSVLVPGDASRVWAVNDWIAGQVVYANPNNSYTTQPDYPPEKGASDFLLNPRTSKLVTFKMSSRGEILWVESDTVYYRSGAGLFRARIGDKNLVDQELILTDPRVEEIHWAYRRRVMTE
jgi:hypothetical protein